MGRDLTEQEVQISMWGMFRSSSLNSPITLYTDNVNNMQTMFEGAEIFNSPLNFSNTSNVSAYELDV